MTSLRALLLSAGMCPCDPTRGQSCRYCDGTDADDRERARAHRRRTQPSTHRKGETPR